MPAKAAKPLDVRAKRAYEPAAASDGARVLVDRLWPRGIRKEALAAQRWIKEIAPSDELRRWFGHDARRWSEFRRRYARELAEHRDALDALRALGREAPLTLLYAARDDAHNNAVVLREVLLAPRRGAARREAPAARPAAGARKRKSRAR